MMTRIQTRLKALLTAALLATAFSAHAQEAPSNYVSYPYAFIGLQGGVQETATHYYNNWKLFTPTASVSFGAHFTPVFGARLHVNGIWNKSGIDMDYRNLDETFKYKYITTDLDAMINVVNLFSKNQYRPWNVYLIGGIGLNYAWDTEYASSLKQYISEKKAENRFSHNFRLGGMLDVKVARNWSVNIEVDANCLNDRFNCKTSHNDDWQFTAQLGVAYKFGLPHKAKGNPRSNIIVAPETIGAGTETASANTGVSIDKPEPAPTTAPTVVTPAPEVKKEEITRNIFFEIRKTEVTAKDQTIIAEVAKWLKDHPDAKVTVTGYADKGTGNAANNERFAKQRAESVTKALIKKGVEKSRITTDSKGDRIQPFAENDKNRVTIIVGK
jgi:outer membrane protein OmpA-like peptidoglycan-associated protein